MGPGCGEDNDTCNTIREYNDMIRNDPTGISNLLASIQASMRKVLKISERIVTYYVASMSKVFRIDELDDDSSR